jgi:type IX secretion system PorP/SprF family membrane protein
MGKSYNTFLGSFDMPLKMKKKQGAYIGLGAYVYSDKAGDSRFGTTQGNLSVSAILPTGMTSKFSMGLQTGFAQRSMTLANIQWPNQYNGFNYDPSMSSNEQAGKTSFSYLDIGAGINYDTYHQTEKIDGKNTNRFDIGASFFHATMPLMKYEPMTKEDLYWKGILHTTIRHDIPGTKFGIVPSMVVMVQWPAYEIFLGTLLRYKINEGTKMTGFSNESAFSGGIYYRYKDAISPQVFLELGDYAFGLSYDFNVSTYRQVAKSAGAFELSIRYSSMRGALMKNKR